MDYSQKAFVKPASGSPMIALPGMLMISGNTRNSGKTSLACSVIRRFSKDHRVTGLKVTRIHPGEETFHGDHGGENEADWDLQEETNPSGHKDTSRMLQAGASHVYYIRTTDEHLMEALGSFLKQKTAGTLIVCESRSLRSAVEPGVFILMMRQTEPGKGKDVSTLLALADAVVRNGDDPETINLLTARIATDGNSWQLLP